MERATLSPEPSLRRDGHELTYSESSAWLSGARYPGSDWATGKASFYRS